MRQRGRIQSMKEPIERLNVWAISRIAHNMFSSLRALATLDDAGIEIVSLTEQDTGDASMRKLNRTILAWLAGRDSEELSATADREVTSPLLACVPGDQQLRSSQNGN
jgi:DNA invertase Pin-like site-specific DNA recombinase